MALRFATRMPAAARNCFLERLTAQLKLCPSERSHRSGSSLQLNLPSIFRNLPTGGERLGILRARGIEDGIRIVNVQKNLARTAYAGELVQAAMR